MLHTVHQLDNSTDNSDDDDDDDTYIHTHINCIFYRMMMTTMMAVKIISFSDGFYFILQ